MQYDRAEQSAEQNMSPVLGGRRTARDGRRTQDDRADQSAEQSDLQRALEGARD
jgi:hypothetical protein